MLKWMESEFPPEAGVLGPETLKALSFVLT